MTDDVRRLLRAAAPRTSDVDVGEIRDRAAAIRRNRRLGQLSLFAIAIMAAVLTVDGLLPGDGGVVVEPGPSPAATPSAPAPEGGEESGSGPCGANRRLMAGWLPEGFSSELRPGTADRPAEGVWHWDGGEGRSVEVHVDRGGMDDRLQDYERPHDLESETGDADILGSGGVIGPVPGGAMLTWRDDPSVTRQVVDSNTRCGDLAAVVGYGIEDWELLAVGAHLFVRGEQVEPAAAASVRVRDAELVEDRSGWAETAEGIVRTLDSGSSWWSATPADADPLRLRGTSFFDHRHGWTLELTEQEGGEARLWRTVDGGGTWQAVTVELPPAPPGAYGRVHIDFVDGEHGWLLVSFASNASADEGRVLLATDDGGRSWETLGPPPASAAMTMVTTDVGWVAGGPTGGPTQLYLTSDRGRSWQQVDVPLPQGWEDAEPTHDAPAFSTADDGTLGVTLLTRDDSRAALAVYRTADGGREWELDDLLDVTSTCGPGCPETFYLAGSDSWVFAGSDGSWMSARHEREFAVERGFSREFDHDDLGRRVIRPLSGPLPGPVADMGVWPMGPWALVLPRDGGCTVGTDICLGLYLPAGGGPGWEPARPVPEPPPPACVTDADRRNAPPDDDPATIDLYFLCAGDRSVRPLPVYRVTRPVPPDEQDLAARVSAAVEALLAGPTEEERARGYEGMFGPEVLRAVHVEGDTVTIDLRSTEDIGNISTPTGGEMFFRQFVSTVFATDPSIQHLAFRLDGSCEVFPIEIDLDGCLTADRPTSLPAGWSALRLPHQ